MRHIPSTPAHLDHLVYAGPDLQAMVADFAERTGIEPSAGGHHPTGSANYLVALTVDGARVRTYLELVGPDPGRADPGPVTTFGIDQLTRPRLVAFAIRPPDPVVTVARARAGGYDPGPLDPLSRHTPTGGELHWHLTQPPSRPTLIPFLIAWGETAHPALEDIDSVELLELSGRSPHAQRDRHVLDLLGVHLPISAGEQIQLTARLRTPAGEVELT